MCSAHSGERPGVKLRPTEDRTGTGTVTPTYLRRRFTYLSAEQFIGMITLFADNDGQLPLMEFEFKGSNALGRPAPHRRRRLVHRLRARCWLRAHPLHEQAAAMLNQVPVDGVEPFTVGRKQDILQKPFPMFNIAAGQIVSDYDLIHFNHGLLFMGAKHVDGTPFDRPEQRPTSSRSLSGARTFRTQDSKSD
jgi:hypothetical protein